MLHNADYCIKPITTNKYLQNSEIDLNTFDFNDLLKAYEGLDPSGWNLLIRIYEQPVKEKTEGGLYLPDTSIDKARIEATYGNLVGIVVKMASGVYKDEERYALTGPYCKVGDWVHFPRASGNTMVYKGMTSIFIKEDLIDGVVKDPRDVERLRK